MQKTNLLRRHFKFPNLMCKPLAETPMLHRGQGRRLGKTMKVALVHDYIKGEGGAEQVLLTLHEMFPEAPIYTIFSNVGRKRLGVLGMLGWLGGLKEHKKTTFEEKYEGAKIVTSWFDKLPYREKLMSPLRFLLPVIWGGFDFSEYDLVISSASWAVTKGFTNQEYQGYHGYHGYHEQSPTSSRFPSGLRGALREICYCHTPPRILYGYETSRNWKKHWYIRIYALITNHFLRQYDYKQAQKVTQFVANSKVVQDRIWKFYRRESEIINPPVDVERFRNKSTTSITASNAADASTTGTTSKKDGSYYLAGGRLEMPKNFDKIILACNQLKVPLKIYGSGPQMESLKSIAGPTVELLGGVSDELKIKLYQNCKAYITAAVDEDFGITPVEAMAAGKPVLAYAGGGYLETVVQNKTGLFFKEASIEGIVKVIKSFKEEDFNSDDCVRRASQFSKEAFKEKLSRLIKQILTD